MMGNRTCLPIQHVSRLWVLRTGTAAVLALLAVSCAQLPRLEAVGASAGPGIEFNCDAVFPEDRWRLVHAIETVISGEPAGVVIGVTIIAPAGREVEAIIMTLEGLVLFHARSSGETMDVLRAIAPFDTPFFAKGLIEDVALLFLAPVAVKTMSGFSSDGSFTCRYIRSDESAVDVMPAPDGDWTLLEYDRRASLRRRVTATRQGNCLSNPAGSLPCHIDLEALQRPAYTLRMSLIEAEIVAEGNQ